jgi:hypothetical protein
MAYTINLTHRGPQVIECIDLFDEARYGADKLFFRKRCETVAEVEEQVIYAFDKTQAPQGGNPLTPTPESGDLTGVPTIALNRYHIPNKKFWNNVVPDVEEPYRASAAVKFSIRVHFRDDYAYIDFGCPWELVDNGKLTTSSDAQAFINEFVLLHCHFISKEDALQILDSLFSKTSANTAAYAIMRNAPKIIIETTELVDEDGSIIAL